MKITFSFLSAALFATLPFPGWAAGENDGHGGHSTAQAAPVSEVPLSEGTVKKVDRAAGKVTLSHGPLLNLGMNMAMTMAFRVRDASWLDQMKVGDKIRFIADNVDGALTVVKFEPVK